MAPTQQNNKIIPFIVLDHNRENESKLLLQSLKKHIKLKNYVPKIVYMSNGGQQDYVWQFYKDGLIDDLILKRENLGTGYGTADALWYCMRQDWGFYIQNDHILASDITDELIDTCIEKLGDCQRYSHVDLSGNQGHGKYSERAQFIGIKFYNNLKRKGFGGPGPFHLDLWSEQDLQQIFKEKGLGFILGPPIFANNGKWSVRQWECGTETKHRTDTKEMEFTKLPKDGKFCNALVDFYRLTEGEIDVILSGNWGFSIPEQMKKDSFRIPQWDQIP